jgi:hypothetical protein
VQAGPDAVYCHRRCPELKLTRGLAVIRASVSAAVLIRFQVSHHDLGTRCFSRCLSRSLGAQTRPDTSLRNAGSGARPPGWPTSAASCADQPVMASLWHERQFSAAVQIGVGGYLRAELLLSLIRRRPPRPSQVA